MAEQKKVKFAGVVKSVQPRSNVWRYRLDNRNNLLMMRDIWMTYAQSDVETMNNKKVCTSKAHPM